MKWIGEHIFDFISRFRSRVYLEEVVNAGEDTDKFLVTDSDGQVKYRSGAEVLSDIGASSESTDLEFNGDTANGVLTYGGAAQIDVESTMVYSGDMLTLDSSTTAKPVITLRNSNTDAVAPILNFWKTDTGNNADKLGKIRFIGESTSADDTHTFAEITGSISGATAGSETGLFTVGVAENDGTLTSGLVLRGHASTDGRVDVSLAAGATSTTTIEGDLVTNKITHDGNLSITVDNDNNDDNATLTLYKAAATAAIWNLGKGTYSFFSGLGQSTYPRINLNHYTNDQFGGQLVFQKARSSNNVVGGTIQAGQDNDELGDIQWWGMNDAGTPVSKRFAQIVAYMTDATSADEAGKIEIEVYNGTGGGGSQVGFVLDGNTGVAGEVDATIARGAGSTTTIAGQSTFTGNATFTGTTNTMSSSASNQPELRLENTHTDTKSSNLVFYKDDDGTNNDELGNIWFNGKNAGGDDRSFANIKGGIIEASAGNEEGRLWLGVASHDAEMQYGLKLESGDVEDEVDVIIGRTSTSMTTIAGDLRVTGGDLFGPTDGDFYIGSDVSMRFGVDMDADQDRLFSWHNNAGSMGPLNQMMTLTEAGILTLGDVAAPLPELRILNYSNDAAGAKMVFKSQRGALVADAQDLDEIGSIIFTGYDDDTPNLQDYCRMVVKISDASHTDEAGKLEFDVASEGSLLHAISATGSGTASRVDVQLAHGTDSLTSLAGDLSIKGEDITSIGALNITPGSAFRINGPDINQSIWIDANTTNTNTVKIDAGIFDVNATTYDIDATSVSITGTSNEIVGKTAINRRQFAIPGDGGADGDIIYIGANTGGTATVAGKIYYYASTGLWVLTNADDPDDATGLLAVALGADPDVDGMLLRGTVDLAGNIVGTEALGSILYLDKATDGDATTAPPTATGDIVRVIGYALTTGNTNNIWFNPDNTWVEHT